ncbi:MAG: hypothetical protein ACI8W3_000712, partial [Myxococcota bacterium]
GTYQLARSHKLGSLEATLAALIFSLGGVYAQRLTHGQFEWIAIAWIPFVLLAVNSFIDKPLLRTACLGGLGLAMIFLDGGPYQFAFFGVFLALYVGVRAFELKSVRPFLGLASIGAVSISLAAIKLMPIFELIGRYPRETSEDPFYEAPFTPGALELLNQMFLSRAQSHDPTQWMPYVLNVGSYVGVLPLFLVAAAIVFATRRNAAFLVSGLLALWISLGPAAPIDLWHWLHQLPGLSQLRVPSRFNVYTLLCIALLAGAGLGVVRERLAASGRGALVSMAIIGIVASDLVMVNGDIFKVAFSIPPLPIANPEPFRQHYAYSPFIERYRETALYEVHPNWPSGSYPAVLENRGVRWAFKTIPFSSYALSTQDAGYRGETYFVSGQAEITALSWSPNRIRVETNGAAGLLEFNTNYDPGWRVTGTPQPSLAERDGLIGVNVPEGCDAVELVYRPQSFMLGAGVTSLSLLAVLAVVARKKTRGDEA